MTRRALSSVITALFLLAGPGMVAGVIPWWISGWQLPPANPVFLTLRILGGLLIAGALCVLLDSFARFAWKRLGSPAPPFPTQQLVASGWYRWVRNPMYVAVVSLIWGQALVFGSFALAGYGALVWACFHAFVILYEEPTLRRTFGADYEKFRAQAPRWVPRVPSRAL